MSSAAWKLLHKHLGYEKGKIRIDDVSLSMLDEYADVINGCKSVEACHKLERQLADSLGYYDKSYRAEAAKKTKFLCFTFEPTNLYELAVRRDAVASAYGLVLAVVEAKREALESEVQGEGKP